MNFKWTVALSILSTGVNSWRSCLIDCDVCDYFTDTTWKTLVALVCITKLLIPPNICSSSKVFVTNLLTSLENITSVVSAYH